MKKIIGIVVEYNPFHNGHLYQINKIKKKYNDSIIIVCISSSFTQRGDISILNKFEKVKIALENRIDLVIELPYIYTVQGSDIFAKYSLEILNNLKIDTLCFGIENDNINNLIRAAKTQLNNKKFDNKVKEYLDLGINYPTALNKSLKDLIDIEIKEPNELLALSYIKEIIKNDYNIELFPIKRTSDYHDILSDNDISSASNIRYSIQNNIEYKNKIPSNVYNILKTKTFNNKYFEYLKYKILSEDNLSKYLDVNEGLNIRIKESIYKSNSLDELINNIKTKRYTYNRISRILNHILCSLTKEEINLNKQLEYIRILGFSKNGQKHLNNIKKDIKLPILNKYNTSKYKTLLIEKRVSDIYSIIYDDIIKDEISNKPLIHL